MDYISIGAAPADEDCVQVGSFDYHRRSTRECLAFVEAIRKKLGPEPSGARLKVKSFPHDFGDYHEVVCVYNEDNEEAAQYAFKCESDSPSTWAEVGMEAPV